MTTSGMSLKLETLLLAVVATGAGTAVSCNGETYGIVISGITTATVIIEGSVDDTVFEAIADASVTADGAISVTGPFTSIRANVTAWTSGTITVKALV